MSNNNDTFINDLESLHKEICSCAKCIHRDLCAPTYTYLGKDNRILILGEAPAKNGWRISGRAWYEPSGKITATGKILKQLLSEIGLTLEDLSFTEAVKCAPLAPKFLKECGKNCYPFLLRQLEILKPKIIIPLGVRATELILPKFNKFSDVVGCSHQTKFGIVIPIYHPSPISPIGYKANVPIMQTIKDILGS